MIFEFFHTNGAPIYTGNLATPDQQARFCARLWEAFLPTLREEARFAAELPTGRHFAPTFYALGRVENTVNAGRLPDTGDMHILGIHVRATA